jgi:hypothetical protein
VALYNPLTGDASALARFVPASIAAFVVPGLVYGIGMRRWMARATVPAAHIVRPNI